MFINFYDINLTGYNPAFLDIIYIIAIFLASLVIINKNPIVSILFLIGLFGSIACYLLFIDLKFIAFSYLIVYVGAVSILFLFILMLINIRVSELKSNNGNSIPLAIIILMVFNDLLFKELPYSITLSNKDHSFQSKGLSEMVINNNFLEIKNFFLYFVSGERWDSNLAEFSHISSIGNIMYVNYSVWLILASFILLLAMVGSIVITMKPNLLKNNLV